jgi:hypothetical protein
MKPQQAKSFHFCPRCNSFSFFKRHICDKCTFRVFCWFAHENSYQFYIKDYLITCDYNKNQTEIYITKLSSAQYPSMFERCGVLNSILSPKLTEEDLRKLLILL